MAKRSNNKLRKQLAVLLIAIFVIPIAYQTIYIAINHYQEFICTAKNENHFHIKHKSNTKYLLSFTPTIQANNNSILIIDFIFKPLLGELKTSYKSNFSKSLIPRAPPLS